MSNTKKSAKQLALSGIIACLYFIVVMIFFPISYGGVQVRIAEALTLLPLFFGEAVLGLTVGCLLANFFGNGVIDIVFGTLATFLASVTTYLIGKKIKNVKLKFILGALPPIILNAIIIPFTFLAIFELKELYFISMLQIFIGQTISIYIIGSFVYFPLNKIQNKKIKDS
jgi:uncharacterized membrane protein